MLWKIDVVSRLSLYLPFYMRVCMETMHNWMQLSNCPDEVEGWIAQQCIYHLHLYIHINCQDDKCPQVFKFIMGEGTHIVYAASSNSAYNENGIYLCFCFLYSSMINWQVLFLGVFSSHSLKFIIWIKSFNSFNF